MIDALPARGTPIEIFAGKRTVDAERGARAFRGRNDYQLDVLDDIARDKDARNAGGFIAAAANAALLRNLTTQLACNLRLRHARCIEKQCAARQSTTAFEYHGV